MHQDQAFVLGLDLGSSSCKVCAMDTAGRVLGSMSAAYPTLVPHSSWAEQDPQVWLPAIAEATRRLLQHTGLDGSRALGLAITSAAHIAVLLDSRGKVLRNALLWSDQRSDAQARAIAASAGEEVLRLSGNWPTPTWSLPHLAWIGQHEPQVLAATRHVMLSKDYIAYLLTGEIATDPSAAVSAMLLDRTSGQWSQRLCDFAGVELDWLPKVVPTAGEIGRLSQAGAQVLGLSPSAKVFSGSMDSTAETFAAGVRHEGQFVIRLASAGGLHVISRSGKTDRQLISYPYGNGGYWLSQAGTNTCGTAVSWACEMFSQGREDDFEAWSGLAAQSPPGANGVMFHPYLSGERVPYWDSSLRAAFSGLALHTERRDMARAVYEGTSYALRDAAGVLERMGYRFDEIKIVGGGTKSRTWMQIIATLFDCPVRPTPGADSSTGAALYSLIGLGCFAGFDAVPSDLLADDTVQGLVPDAQLRQFYQAQFEQYRFAQQHVAAMSHYQAG